MVGVKHSPYNEDVFRPLLVVGARPNLIKMAAVYHALNKFAFCKPTVLHTGQHYDHDMSGSFFQQLDLPSPNFHFKIQNRERADLLKEVENKTIDIIKSVLPDCMVVFGDVNSTLAAARASKHEGLHLIHVEAGLRSDDLRMPEELNRIETDRISDLLFATERSALDHLIKEGIPRSKCHLVGNVMIDTLIKYKPNVSRRIKKQYILWTVHRPANVDSETSLSKMLKLLELASKEHLVVWPLHPRTRSKLEKFDIWKHLGNVKNLKVATSSGLP